jgi:carbon starvation protein
MFLKKSGRRIIMLLIPTIVMLTVTFSSLLLSIKDRALLLWQGSSNPSIVGLQLGISLLLFVLGILVAISCGKKLLQNELPAPDHMAA